MIEKTEEKIGGPDRDRTDDLLHAMQARSQLRYRPLLVFDYFSPSNAKQKILTS